MALSLPIYFLGNTYVVHFRVQGTQIKRTLRTADPRIAKLRALKLMETGSSLLLVKKSTGSFKPFTSRMCLSTSMPVTRGTRQSKTNKSMVSRPMALIMSCPLLKSATLWPADSKISQTC
jgi:hypothetical protein